MNIVIGSEISITNPPEQLVKEIRTHLTVKNPEYQNRARRGLWLGRTPQTLSLYRTDGNRLIIPCGTANMLGPYMQEDTIVIMDLAPDIRMPFPGTVPLYEYQKDAVKKMREYSCGILQSPCGSGKTQMGLALAAAVGHKTLWVTHTQDLLNQSYERAAQYFPETVLGKITAGKAHVGSHITFATVQTLSKLDLSQYRYAWGTVIVDECHRLAGTPTAVTMFYKVMSHLAARHKYGLSATVHRSDGLIQSTFAIIGPVVHRVPDEAVADKTMPVRICRRDTHVPIGKQCLDTDGTLLYSELIPYLTEHAERNQQIIRDLVANADHSCLILSDRLDHLRMMIEGLPPELRTQAAMIDGKMTSKKAKAERIQAIEDMRSGKKRFLFASYSLAKEGLDIPRLDRLFLTTPKKDYAVVTQSIGRIARKCEGKKDAVAYDYVDDIGFCENQWKKRKTSYRKAGCEIG